MLVFSRSSLFRSNFIKFPYTSPVVPYFGTMGLYFCHINLKTEVNMWLAVIVFVSLSVEVLSYLTGGDTKNGIIIKENEKSSPEAA